MNRNRILILATVFVLAIISGITVSNFMNSDTYCQNIEDQIRSQQNFTGSVACYPPGVVDVNLSDEVRNETELRCVCRKVNDGVVELFPITMSK